MTNSNQYQPNPELDLMFERVVDVPRELVWTAWTTPEQLKQWFTPVPWKTVDCEIDLRAGGIFSTVMRSPEGQDFPNIGCYLEVVNNEKLVWTNALEPGFRPANQSGGSAEHPCAEFALTAVISLAAHTNGTKYTALVMHADKEARVKHEQMGFHEGWEAALDQLVTMIKKM
ncbi:SRPBCC family protein [Methyloglobulus sp.]|uniref:SRPBCC family protein n=1 Tax=Methyloglobulus sp. TaxID=2518622 RepID=UPI003988B853